MTGWKPLDPYVGEEPQVLTGQALRDEIAHYRRTADQNGEPHDPEWDRWLTDDEFLIGSDRLQG